MKQLLTLNLPPSHEDRIIDYLLELEYVEGFSSYPVRGHGDHEHLTVAEQVSGRRQRLQVEMVMEENDIPSLLAGLRDDVGSDIVFWVMPVLKHGRV